MVGNGTAACRSYSLSRIVVLPIRNTGPIKIHMLFHTAFQQGRLFVSLERSSGKIMDLDMEAQQGEGFGKNGA